MNGWGCSAFWSLLEKGEESKECISKMAVAFLDLRKELDSEFQVLRQHDVPEVQLIADSVDRVSRLCRALLLLSNVSVENDIMGEDTPVSNVLYFTQYSGKLGFERSIRQSFASEYYKMVIQDVMKTAVTSKTLTPKLDALKVLLAKEGQLGCEDLVTACNLLSELKAGMRQGSLITQEKAVIQKLTKFAESLLSSGAVSISTLHAKVLLKALSQFQESPGVLDLIHNIEKYMTSHAGILASGDLETYLDKVTEGHTATVVELNPLVTQCDRTTVSKDLLLKLDDHILDICGSAGAQACFLGFGDLGPKT